MIVPSACPIRRLKIAPIWERDPNSLGRKDEERRHHRPIRDWPRKFSLRQNDRANHCEQQQDRRLLRTECRGLARIQQPADLLGDAE